MIAFLTVPYVGNPEELGERLITDGESRARLLNALFEACNDVVKCIICEKVTLHTIGIYIPETEEDKKWMGPVCRYSTKIAVYALCKEHAYPVDLKQVERKLRMYRQ